MTSGAGHTNRGDWVRIEGRGWTRAAEGEAGHARWRVGLGIEEEEEEELGKMKVGW